MHTYIWTFLSLFHSSLPPSLAPTLSFSPVQDFEETLALVSEYQFPSLFINQFYPRPGTPAARMKRIPTQEVALLYTCISHLSPIVGEHSVHTNFPPEVNTKCMLSHTPCK